MTGRKYLLLMLIVAVLFSISGLPAFAADPMANVEFVSQIGGAILPWSSMEPICTWALGRAWRF